MTAFDSTALSTANRVIERIKALCDSAERKDAEQVTYDGTRLLPVVYVSELRAALAGLGRDGEEE